MKVRSRFAPALLALLGALLLPATPRVGSAQQQAPPIELIKVDQVNAMLQKGAPVKLIDVRSRQEYLTRHIKGAMSVPLDTVELRAGEIPRQGLVVLY
jgi:3-mercaptopyruvate sulfurtransferase SseA